MGYNSTIRRKFGICIDCTDGKSKYLTAGKGVIFTIGHPETKGKFRKEKTYINYY